MPYSFIKYPRPSTDLIDIGHSLRVNADFADTPLKKSLRQFCKYCWPNLNYGKIYIFISNTFFMLSSLFSANKFENALSCPYKWSILGKNH